MDLPIEQAHPTRRETTGRTEAGAGQGRWVRGRGEPVAGRGGRPRRAVEEVIRTGGEVGLVRARQGDVTILQAGQGQVLPDETGPGGSGGTTGRRCRRR